MKFTLPMLIRQKNIAERSAYHMRVLPAMSVSMSTCPDSLMVARS